MVWESVRPKAGSFGKQRINDIEEVSKGLCILQYKEMVNHTPSAESVCT